MTKPINLTNQNLEVLKDLLKQLTGRCVNPEDIKVNEGAFVKVYDELFTFGFVDEIDYMTDFLNMLPKEELKEMIRQTDISVSDKELYLIHILREGKYNFYNLNSGLLIDSHIDRILVESLFETLNNYKPSDLFNSNYSCNCGQCGDKCDEDDEEYMDEKEYQDYEKYLYQFFNLENGKKSHPHITPENPIKVKPHEMENLIKIFDEYKIEVEHIQTLLENGFYDINDETSLVFEVLSVFEYVKNYVDENVIDSERTHLLNIVLENEETFNNEMHNCLSHYVNDEYISTWSLQTGDLFEYFVLQQASNFEKMNEELKKKTREEVISDLYSRFCE